MPPRCSLPLPLLLLCGALLAADAAFQQRCTEISEGRVDGKPVALDPTYSQPYERRLNITIPITQTCGAGGAAGVIVTACDVVPPELRLDEDEWAELHVLRLGPTWAPLLLELTLFCETEPTAATSPAPTAPPTTNDFPPGPYQPAPEA